MKYITYLLALCSFLLHGCKKDFLNKKPTTDITIPNTLPNLFNLLDNTDVMSYTTGLGQIASGEFTTPYSIWQAVSQTQRNDYIWSPVIYNGDINIADWNKLYTEIFYANVVLQELSNIPLTDKNKLEWDFIKGWAQFSRSYAFYNLLETFSAPFDSTTFSGDLGIPLKLSPDVDLIVQRASVQNSYDQLLKDLKQSCALLPIDYQHSNPNRPSKISAYALLARIYLSTHSYDKALKYSDSCLDLYNVIVDYNTLDVSLSRPFSNTFPEIIYYSFQNSYLLNSLGTPFTNADSGLVSLYSMNDLRLNAFFNANGSPKYNYSNNSRPFSGLATDEMLLIKAECLARNGQSQSAIDILTLLLNKRYKTGTFIPYTALNWQEVLSLVLSERRKELTARGLRWTDIRRLNKEGANITLTRILNGQYYTLLPNDKRFALPIPDDEIALSGIINNVR